MAANGMDVDDEDFDREDEEKGESFEEVTARADAAAQEEAIIFEQTQEELKRNVATGLELLKPHANLLCKSLEALLEQRRAYRVVGSKSNQQRKGGRKPDGHSTALVQEKELAHDITDYINQPIVLVVLQVNDMGLLVHQLAYLLSYEITNREQSK